MTFQPPPQQPPGGAPPPPPPGPPSGPPGGWGPPPPSGGYGGPPSGKKSFDPRSINPLDWGILAAGVLAFLFSFIDYYDGVDVSGGGRSVTVDDSGSAWNDIIGGGFFNWFAMLLAIAGAVVVAVTLFQPRTKLPLPARLLGLGLFGLATVFIIIGIFVTPGESRSIFGSDYEASANHGFGFWVSLIVIIAGLVLSLMRFQQTGGKLPGGLSDNVPNLGQYGPQGGITGGSTGAPQGYSPPTPSYGPPQGQYPPPQGQYPPPPQYQPPSQGQYQPPSQGQYQPPPSYRPPSQSPPSSQGYTPPPPASQPSQEQSAPQQPSQQPQQPPQQGGQYPPPPQYRPPQQ